MTIRNKAGPDRDSGDPGPTRKIGAGMLAASFRQGAKEIGTALKAFPDSVSVDEPGTLFSPTQGEIAAGRSGTIWGRTQEAKERSQARGRDEPERDLERD